MAAQVDSHQGETGRRSGGIVANSREDFVASEKWYLKALEIHEELNDETDRAHTYFNLSRNAKDQKNDEAAEDWLQKTIQLFDKKGDVYAVIRLGRDAGRQSDFVGAEKLYQKALEIAKKNGNDEQESNCYVHLGSLASQQCDYEASKKWYRKALEIHEKCGSIDHAAKCCTSLGNLCLAKTVEKPRDFKTAKKWFQKALEIDDSTTWRDGLRFRARLWRYKFLSLISK